MIYWCMHAYQFHLGFWLFQFRMQEIADSIFRISVRLLRLDIWFHYFCTRTHTHTHKQSIVLYCIYRMNECLSDCLTVFRSVCLIELWSNLVHITFLPVIIINTIIYIMYTFVYNTQIPFHSRAAKGVNVWVRKSQWYFFSIFFSVA